MGFSTLQDQLLVHFLAFIDTSIGTSDLSLVTWSELTGGHGHIPCLVGINCGIRRLVLITDKLVL